MTETDNGAVFKVKLDGGTKANTKYFIAILQPGAETVRCGDPTTTPPTTPITPLFYARNIMVGVLLIARRSTDYFFLHLMGHFGDMYIL